MYFGFVAKLEKRPEKYDVFRGNLQRNNEKTSVQLIRML